MSRLANLTEPALRQLQFERLRAQLARIGQSNRFWQSRLPNASAASLEDLLQQLPLTSKSELVADQAQHPPYGTNLSHELSAFTRLHQTSGTTTGIPLRWLDTAESWNWILECWAQLFEIAGLEARDRVFFPFSFGPFLGFWAGFEGAQRLGNFCLAGGGMSSQARLRMLIDNSMTVVCCTPTYALRLAEVAREEGIDLARQSVRLLIVAGEAGGSVGAIRHRIESAWGARVIDHWGMTELGPLAIECAAQLGGLHLLETECLVEILDPSSGQTAPTDADGYQSGELVVTNLGREGSPLLRYRTGDLVRATRKPCACGRPLVWLEGGILSRADDMLIIRGNNVFPATIEALLREFSAIVEYRIQIRTEREMTHVAIQIEPVADISAVAAETLAAEVSLTIKSRLNFVPEVHLAAPGSLPRFEMKGRRIERV